MDELRRAFREGRIVLPGVGVIQRAEPPGVVPYVVLVDGTEVEAVSSYLSSLVPSDLSPLTVRSYTQDLLVVVEGLGGTRGAVGSRHPRGRRGDDGAVAFGGQPAEPTFERV
ncbi:hypothetical protein ACWFRB_16260 [Rhodococcus sp. NPDC055112]